MEYPASAFDPKTLIERAITHGHCILLGFKMVDNGPDWCEFSMPYNPDFAADAATGIMASGPIFALMDMVSGMSIWMAKGHYIDHVTLDLRVDYPRPAKPGATIFGRSQCYRMTKSIAFVRGLAHDGDRDDPVAQIAGTFMFINPS